MDENTDTCSWCGEKYNPDEQGHYDEATGLMFCQQTCECQYDQETGLPDNYKRAFVPGD